MVVRGQVLQQDAARVEGGERDLHGRVVAALPAGQRRHAELLRVEGDGVVGAVAAAHAHLARLALAEGETEQHRARHGLRLHTVLPDERGVRGARHSLQRADVHGAHGLALLARGGVVPHEVEVNHRHGHRGTRVVLALRHDHELVLLVEGAAVVRLAGEGGVDRVDLQQPRHVCLVRQAEGRVGAHATPARPGDEVVVQGAHVALAQVREVIDVEALEVQLLLAVERRVAGAVRRDRHGAHAVLRRRFLQRLRGAAERGDEEGGVLLQQTHQRHWREGQQVVLQHGGDVAQHLRRETATGDAGRRGQCRQCGEGVEEVELGDERLRVGLHGVEVLHAGPEVDAPELVLLLVRLDPTHDLPRQRPLLQHRVGDAGDRRLRLLLLLAHLALLLRRGVRGGGLLRLPPLLLRVVPAVAQVHEHAVLLVARQQVPRLQRAERVEGHGAVARAALHAAGAALSAEAAHELRALAGDARDALHEHLGAVEVQRQLGRVVGADEVDEEALGRAVHRAAGLLADVAAHLARAQAVGAHGADPVALGHLLDAVAALVHGDVAAVAEDQHVARLAVALAADVAHLVVLLHLHWCPF